MGANEHRKLGNRAYITVAILTQLRLVARVAAHGHFVHARVDSHHLATSLALNLAQSDAAVLILGGHLLPLLDLRHTSASHRIERIRHSLATLHIAQFDKRDRN
jgi:hypothetical protein